MESNLPITFLWRWYRLCLWYINLNLLVINWNVVVKILKFTHINFIWIALKKSSLNHENGPCRWGEESMFKFDTSWIKKNVLWVVLCEGNFIFFTLSCQRLLKMHTYYTKHKSFWFIQNLHTLCYWPKRKINFVNLKANMFSFHIYIYIWIFPLVLEINAYPILIIS